MLLRYHGAPAGVNTLQRRDDPIPGAVGAHATVDSALPAAEGGVWTAESAARTAASGAAWSARKFGRTAADFAPSVVNGARTAESVAWN